jgi:hypothetical protein
MTRFGHGRRSHPMNKGIPMKVRLIALAAAAAVGLAAMPGANAVPPQITDPTGDVKGAQAAYDITSVTFDTIKVVSYKTVKAGKKKRVVAVYTPTDLTITMNLAGAPDVKPGTSYQIMAQDTPCGLLYAYTYFSARSGGRGDSMQFGNCGPSTPTGDNFVLGAGQFTVSMVGKSIVWRAPLKNLPPSVKVNSIFAGLSAYTAVTEPLFGYSGVDFAEDNTQAEAFSLDFAASDKVYKIGS